MKFLQDQFDKARPLFEKGGPLEALYPLFEAKETFMFTPGMRTTSGSHVRDRLDTKRLMSTVIAALIPTLVFGMYNVGYQHMKAQGLPVSGEPEVYAQMMLIGARYVVPIIITSYAVGGIWELIFAVANAGCPVSIELSTIPMRNAIESISPGKAMASSGAIPCSKAVVSGAPAV